MEEKLQNLVMRISLLLDDDNEIHLPISIFRGKKVTDKVICEYIYEATDGHRRYTHVHDDEINCMMLMLMPLELADSDKLDSSNVYTEILSPTQFWPYMPTPEVDKLRAKYRGEDGYRGA